MTHRHPHTVCEVKAQKVALQRVEESGQFEGYACLFGKEDLGKDIIRPGAFAKSLARRGPQSIKMLYQHDPAQPVGQWLTIREDAKGLFVKGQLALEVEKARDILAMMKSGILDGLSIGFRTIRGNKDAKSGVRHLMELDLWEISIVTFPMQPDARISTVKNASASASASALARTTMANPFTKRILERKLTRDAGLTRSQAHALMAHGYDGLGSMRDAARPVHGSTSDQLNGLAHMLTKATLQMKSK